MLESAFFLIAATAFQQDCAIHGSVTDAATGNPISQVQIALDDLEGIGAASDNEGNFRIAVLSCGKARLFITKRGFEARSLPGDPTQQIQVRLEREAGISGMVLDTSGQPIPDAVVQALTSGMSPIPVPFKATTDQSGQFTLRLQPFAYTVCAHSEGSVYPVGGGSRLRYGDHCEKVDLTRTRQQRIEFTLAALPSVHVSGSVSGLPEGVVPVVSLYLRGRPSDDPAAIKSAPGGIFDFGGVVPDVYTIQVSAVDGDKPFFSSEEISVGTGGMSGLTLAALPAIDLTGSVRFRSSSGKDNPRLRLDLIPASGSVEWDGDSFTISNVLQRDQRLVVMPITAEGGPASSDYYVESIRIGGRDSPDGEFPAVAGMGAIEITMADEIGTVDAAVSDADGKPVSVAVWLFGAHRQMRLTSDDDGKLPGLRLPSGEYMFYAGDAPPADAAALDTGVKVQVPSGGNVKVSLKWIPH